MSSGEGKDPGSGLKMLSVGTTQFTGDTKSHPELDDFTAGIRALEELSVHTECPEIEGVDISAFSKPAGSVGGDYYDFIRIDKSRLAVVVADVAGKGVAGALIMAMVRCALQSCAPRKLRPDKILTEMNDFLFRYTKPDVFVTMLLAVLHTDRCRLELGRAGHEPLIHFLARTGSHRIVAPEGIALGMESRGVFGTILRQEEIQLARGDSLIFYTDGITDARNSRGESFSSARLMNAAVGKRSAAEILHKIRRSIAEFTGNTPQYDDQTVVVLNVRMPSYCKWA